ncbi:MAG: dipeptide epimerase [Verrucomicrobiales bacterium]|nr:dipeptide epimerase [Verrucomicrobiales bacterium]
MQASLRPATSNRMLVIDSETVLLKKRVPLTITRGTRAESRLLWVRVCSEGIEGWGEAGEFSVGPLRQDLAELETQAQRVASMLAKEDPFDRAAMEHVMLRAQVPSALRAAVDQALWDWSGKRLGQPVWRLLGLSSSGAVPTSVTIGICAPEVAQQRVHEWQLAGEVQAFKVKLGSPLGLEADRAMFQAIRSLLPDGFHISVDANGGWDPAQAIEMSRWLADRGVDHLEQPLARGREKEMVEVCGKSALPILLDESCFTSADIPDLAEICHGINIKLYKCGGVSEALRMIAVARAHDLKVMLGCYGNSALGNTAAAHLGTLVDYLDLDSHLNLVDDPFQGASWIGGHLQLSSLPGFGVSHEHVPTH